MAWQLYSSRNLYRIKAKKKKNQESKRKLIFTLDTLTQTNRKQRSVLRARHRRYLSQFQILMTLLIELTNQKKKVNKLCETKLSEIE